MSKWANTPKKDPLLAGPCPQCEIPNIKTYLKTPTAHSYLANILTIIKIFT